MLVPHQPKSKPPVHGQYLLRLPTETGVDMAPNPEFQTFLAALRGEGSRLLILVEDSAAPTGWRILSEEDLVEIGLGFETSISASGSVPRRLCYNVEEAAKAVGVSVHKFGSWLKRPERPVPHMKDGRRILIPIVPLEDWLRDEADRNTGTSVNAH